MTTILHPGTLGTNKDCNRADTFRNVLFDGCWRVKYFDDCLQIHGYRRCVPFLCCCGVGMGRNLRMFTKSRLQMIDLKTWIHDEGLFIVAKDFFC